MFSDSSCTTLSGSCLPFVWFVLVVMLVLVMVLVVLVLSLAVSLNNPPAAWVGFWREWGNYSLCHFLPGMPRGSLVQLRLAELLPPAFRLRAAPTPLPPVSLSRCVLSVSLVLQGEGRRPSPSWGKSDCLGHSCLSQMFCPIKSHRAAVATLQPRGAAAACREQCAEREAGGPWSQRQDSRCRQAVTQPQRPWCAAAVVHFSVLQENVSQEETCRPGQ